MVHVLKTVEYSCSYLIQVKRIKNPKAKNCSSQCIQVTCSHHFGLLDKLFAFSMFQNPCFVATDSITHVPYIHLAVTVSCNVSSHSLQISRKITTLMNILSTIMGCSWRYKYSRHWAKPLSFFEVLLLQPSFLSNTIIHCL